VRVRPGQRGTPRAEGCRDMSCVRPRGGWAFARQAGRAWLARSLRS
jgi:hypothetical protein